MTGHGGDIVDTHGGEVIVCGVDEAGRGCLAGPITAAAVIFPPGSRLSPDEIGLKDSKVLTESKRDQLSNYVHDAALAVGLGWATAREIDNRGIEWANRIVFTRAVKAALTHVSPIPPNRIRVLIDGNRKALRLGLMQETVVKGDAFVTEIMAAGIVAKVARDHYIRERLHARYPSYGFDRHKGYGTKAHRDAIAKWGLTPYHRRSFHRGGGNE